MIVIAAPSAWTMMLCSLRSQWMRPPAESGRKGGTRWGCSRAPATAQQGSAGLTLGEPRNLAHARVEERSAQGGDKGGGDEEGGERC